jgi:hypothetical protein
MRTGCIFALGGVLLIAILTGFVGPLLAPSIPNLNPEKLGQIGFVVIVIPAFFVGYWLQKKKEAAKKSDAPADKPGTPPKA